jgi:hypothetical protein
MVDTDQIEHMISSTVNRFIENLKTEYIETQEKKVQ